MKRIYLTICLIFSSVLTGLCVEPGIIPSYFTVDESSTSRNLVINYEIKNDDYTSTHDKSNALIPLLPESIPEIIITQASFTEYKWIDNNWSDPVEKKENNPEKIDNIVKITPLGIMRHFRIGHLTVEIQKENSAFSEKSLRYYNKLQIVLKYVQNPEGSKKYIVNTDYHKNVDFKKIFSPVLLGYSLIKDDSAFYNTPTEPQPEKPQYLNYSTIKISLLEPGLYRIDYSDIENVFPDKPKISGIRLWNEGNPIRFVVLKKGNEGYRWSKPEDIWVNGDVLVFMGNKSTNPYGRVNHYFLSYTGSSSESTREGLYICDDFIDAETKYSSLPSIIHYEEDHVFQDDGLKTWEQAVCWGWQGVSQNNTFELIPSYPDIKYNSKDKIKFTLKLIPSAFKKRLDKRDFFNMKIRSTNNKTRAWKNYNTADKAKSKIYEKEINMEHVISKDGKAEKIIISTDKKTGKSNSQMEIMYPEPDFLVDWIETEYKQNLILKKGILDIYTPIKEKDKSFNILVNLSGSESPDEKFITDSGEEHPLYIICSQSTSGQSHFHNYIVNDATLSANIKVNNISSEENEKLHLSVTTLGSIAKPKYIKSGLDDSLYNNTNQSDYLLLCHPLFIRDVSEFAKFHKDQKLSTSIVSLEDIYDQFGWGFPSPEAIKSFISYTFTKWSPPAPTYVVLVGDGKWDYWNRYNNDAVNYCPGYRINQSYASDNWFVNIAGDDPLPEMIIGRLPLKNEKQMKVYNQKAVSYFTHSVPGSWRNKVLFLTDNGFENEADHLLKNKFPSYLATKELKFVNYPFIDNFYMPEEIMYELKSKCSPQCTEAIVDALSDGCLLWEYFGHGAPNVLGHERIFFGGGSKYSDVRKLTNDNKLPFLLAWTCDTGRFDYSEDKWHLSIGEDLMFAPKGGTIGQFVSSGRGYPGHHVVLSDALHDCFFVYDVLDFGGSMTLAKLLYLLEVTDPAFLHMFLLQGDPALELAIPKNTISFEINPEEYDSGRRSTCTIRTDRFDNQNVDIKDDYLTEIIIHDGDKNKVTEITGEEIKERGKSYRLTIPEDTAPGTGHATVFYYPVKGGNIGFAGGKDITIKPRSPYKALIVTRDVTPNLTISTEDISFPNFTPKSGETVFIDIVVHNDSRKAVRNISVKAYDGNPDKEGVLITNLVELDLTPIDIIPPKSEGHTRIRWDPVKNAGEHEIWIKVDPDNRIDETDESDNMAYRKLLVKEKADLMLNPERIILKKDSDTNKWNLTFKIRNDGETEATNVAVQITAVLETDGNKEEHKINVPVRYIPPQKSSVGGPIGLPPNLFEVSIVVDPDEMVDEVTHTNNSASRNVNDIIEDATGE